MPSNESDENNHFQSGQIQHEDIQTDQQKPGSASLPIHCRINPDLLPYFANTLEILSGKPSPTAIP
jgi:hypothetical protein